MKKFYQLIKANYNKKVIKDYLAVSGSNIALQPIALLKSFFVAKYLGPSDYGLLKSIDLIRMLNKYGNLGFRQTANREVGDSIGKNNHLKTAMIKSTLYSAELILSILLFLIGASISLFFDDRTIVILIILASTGLLFSKIKGIYSTEGVIQKKFILQSKVVFFSSLISSIIVIIIVPYLKIYAILITDIIGSAIILSLYIKYLDYNFNFHINKKEFKRLFKISLTLTIPTLVLGLYKYSERVLVIMFLGPIALGFFSFSEMITQSISTVLKMSIRVRMQDIYEGLGAGDYFRIHKMAVRETILFTLLSLTIIPIAWYFLKTFIPVFLPNWEEGLFYAQIFLFMIPLHIIPNYFINVLLSSLINAQKITPIFQFISNLILVVTTVTLFKLDMLTIEKYIIVVIIANLFYNISIVILYKIKFYNIYLGKP